jgi:centrosomal protein CEP120
MHKDVDHILGIRDTPEYAAAWDLELWRAVQLAKAQRELKAAERKALEEMRVRVQAKEKAELAHVEKRMRECAAREAALAKATEALEKRKAHVKEVETELRRQLDETDEFRKRLDSECDARVARIKDEVTHRLELQHQRLVEAQDQIKRTDERAANASKEYIKLYEEFSGFKTRMLSQSGPMLTQQLDAMRAQNESNLLMMTERHDRAMADARRAHRDEVAALQAETQKLREALSSKKEQARVAVHTAEQATQQRDEARAEARRLATQLGHAESAIQHFQRQLANAAARAGPPQSVRTDTPAANAARASPGQPEDPQVANARHQARLDIARWQSERANLMQESGGVYTEGSPVIVDLDRRIQHAMQFLSQHQGR